jgi:hypothetical protein
MWLFKLPSPIESPVLVVDALGVKSRIAAADDDALSALADTLVACNS